MLNVEYLKTADGKELYFMGIMGVIFSRDITPPHSIRPLDNQHLEKYFKDLPNGFDPKKQHEAHIKDKAFRDKKVEADPFKHVKIQIHNDVYIRSSVYLGVFKDSHGDSAPYYLSPNNHIFKFKLEKIEFVSPHEAEKYMPASLSFEYDPDGQHKMYELSQIGKLPDDMVAGFKTVTTG